MVRALDDGLPIDATERRLKVPPNSIEAEQSLIGGLMQDNEAWDKVADLIVAHDFYRKDHRLIAIGGGIAQDIATFKESGAPLIGRVTFKSRCF